MISTSILSAALLAVNGNPNVTFNSGAFPLAAKGMVASVMVDPQDWPGVSIAAKNLTSDLAEVSGSKSASGSKVFVGTLGKSPTIDRLVQEGLLDVSAIKGKWEACATQVIQVPKQGRCLVVVGSDKRGTIYGIYDLSKSIGVSPWNWWADVPVHHHSKVYFSGRTVAKPPAVKYRGIFLNDEAPSLSNWVMQNYGGYNHRFYERVFELLLRLRANYLWPAMWNNCFSEDDPLNPVRADEYGIVMGTSHVEPMMRADKEWNRLGYSEKQWNYLSNPKDLDQFWRDGVTRNKPYDNLITIGMRGKIDTPMSESANIELLERIVAAQRKILADVVNQNVSTIPQIWCLYKEVQEYYEKGMRVPDDVTLLWADDNWGNIRRLPTPDERKRSGGAGVYYHFDYVGGPRSYKWIDTNSLPKIWEQMNLAYQYGADKVWIVNVGDLKPMEFATEFFLSMASDPSSFSAKDPETYAVSWATREFGAVHGREIARIMLDTGRLNSRRKPEQLSPSTFSLQNFREAERVVNEFAEVRKRAEAIGRKLASEFQSSYYQLVIHPVKANEVVTRLYVAAAKNELYAKQARAATNTTAREVEDLFEQDKQITHEYHSLNGGKWNHMMDQTHIGYTYWQQPDVDRMPKVKTITLPAKAEMGVACEDGTDSNPGLTFSRFGQSTRRIEVFNRGTTPFTFTATSDRPWIVLKGVEPNVSLQTMLEVSVDWLKIPDQVDSGAVTMTGAGKRIRVPVTFVPSPEKGVGFLEGDGYISIEGEHTSRRVPSHGIAWETLPGYGRTRSAVETFPVEFESFPAGSGPRLEYEFTTFAAHEALVQFVASPTLAFRPKGAVRLAMAFDAEEPKVLDVSVPYLSRDWEISVSDSARLVKSGATNLEAGRHKLKVWALDPGLIIEKINIDLGGLKPSYLGPPESSSTISPKT